MIQYVLPSRSEDRPNYWHIENIHNLHNSCNVTETGRVLLGGVDKDEYQDVTPLCRIISRMIDFDQGKDFRVLVHRDVMEILGPDLVEFQLDASMVIAVIDSSPDLLCWFKLAL